MAHPGSNTHLLPGQLLIGVLHIKGTRWRGLTISKELHGRVEAKTRVYKTMFASGQDRAEKTLSLIWTRMAQEWLDVSEMNAFFWSTTSLDMNQDCAQDNNRGE